MMVYLCSVIPCRSLKTSTKEPYLLTWKIGYDRLWVKKQQKASFRMILRVNHCFKIKNCMYKKYILLGPGKGVECMLSHVHLFVTPRTVAHQTPLSMGFPRQEYWSGLPLPDPGDLPFRASNLSLLCLLHWQVHSLLLCHLGSPKLWKDSIKSLTCFVAPWGWGKETSKS